MKHSVTYKQYLEKEKQRLEKKILNRKGSMAYTYSELHRIKTRKKQRLNKNQYCDKIYDAPNGL